MLWKLKKIWYRAYQCVFRLASSFLDWSETERIEGAGAVKKLAPLIKSKNIRRVLVVTDGGLMKIGLPAPLLASLEENGIDCVVYDGTQPNPSIDNIEEAYRLYRENGCEALIAFGGGSPMDCAKAAAARSVRPKKSVQQMRGLLKVRRRLPPLFAVPTTAGTGSEATIAAVVTDTKTHEKYPINDPKLRPNHVVLDPELTTGLPPHITSTTGMDALTHAVEAYIGRSNTKSTERNALLATESIFADIKRVYADGGDLEARARMLLASYRAGVAFTRAYVGYVHAIAHNLGGLYGVPHGLANAVILPYVLEYYGESAHRRLADLADAAGVSKPGMSDAQKAEAFIAAIKALNADMGIPSGFTQIREEDLPLLVERALREGNPLYPVPKLMNAADCEAVIRRLMIK